MTIPLLFESAAAQLASLAAALRACRDRADAVPVDMAWRSPTGERFRASAATWADDLRTVTAEVEQLDESVAAALDFARRREPAGG